MLDCTPSAYWPLILAYVLPPVGALLSATALWVASRARTTSQVALSTSVEAALSSEPPSARPVLSESLKAAPARRKR
jgi:hypothetical protein